MKDSGLLLFDLTRCLQPQVVPGKFRCHSSTRSAVDKSGFDQERLVDILDGAGIFSNRCSQGIEGLGALSERTAQLPRLDLQIPKRIIGRNTEECILSGTIVGMAAMLDGMVQRIEAELGSPATLILTGGAARFVEPLVLHPHIYDPNLLLKGLAFLCERNCAN